MINSFRGEYSFLSNFHMYDGTSAEHKYQAAKATNISDYRKILYSDSPVKAKRLSKTIKIRENWDDIKLVVMEEILRDKFSRRDLALKLIKTDPHVLIEGNDWGDVFWGVCNGVGENHLGVILMRIRGSFLDNTTKELQKFDDVISY